MTSDVDALFNQIAASLASVDAPADAQVVSADLVAAAAGLSKADRAVLFIRLKAQADDWLRGDLQRCLLLCVTMQQLALGIGDPSLEALALRALGNAYAIGQGEFTAGIQAYDQAAAIYTRLDLPVQTAESVVGKLYALMNLGRYDEALQVGEWARDILRAHEEWLTLARLKTNLALIHSRLGRDLEALELLDLAAEAYRQLGVDGEAYWPRLELNRAVVLRNLGRFDEAIAASQAALSQHEKLGQSVAAARARQNLAVTYFVMGRYNETLVMLEEAREVFQQDDRQRHIVMVELFISDCLLQLRRFHAVIKKCVQARRLFEEIGNHYEAGQALLNEARAYIGLGQQEQALGALNQAREIFTAEKNPGAVAEADLQAAQIYLEMGMYARALDTAEQCREIFSAAEMPVRQARAYQIAARAALALDAPAQAVEYVKELNRLASLHALPGLEFPGFQLQGELAVRQGDLEAGLRSYEQAIQALERLVSAMMIEYRSGFIEDKTGLYEDAVDVCLQLSRPASGMEIAERAKSRALLDMLAHRVDLSIHAHRPQDQPLVDELLLLRRTRDRLLRRWEAGEGFGQRGSLDDPTSTPLEFRQQVITLENRMTTLWHDLLTRSADYARDAALWQVRIEPVQPSLESGTTLLEYYRVHDRLVVFVVKPDDVQVVRLSEELSQIERLVQLVWLNLRSVVRLPASQLEALTNNLQGVLGRLYTALFAPVRELLGDASRLIIVPHGTLHYLPMHALFDGSSYLLEQYEISYLPVASLLRFCLEARPPGGQAAVLGHTFGGRLPYTLSEARSVAAMWHCPPLLEAEATLDNFRQQAAETSLLHLAAHGDFRADNPLFSGIKLEDGWLTTLDIFNLPLRAELVTLSACQTGRSVVGGGDELFGLTRAFLAAGAASLLASLWAVDDESTAMLMEQFYGRLQAGLSRREALRAAQLYLLQAGQVPARCRHPYYWAPFFLVGNPGTLNMKGNGDD
ncbi:MAG: CHAT domain-containing protein [Anaerolineales bacterium]